MKRFLPLVWTAGLILLAGFLFLRLLNPEPRYDPVAFAKAEAHAAAVARAAEIDATWAPVRAAALNVVLISLALLVPVSAALGVAALWLRFRRNQQFIAPAGGIAPLALDHNYAVVAATALLEGHHATERTRAAIQPVPHTFSPHTTYSPHAAATHNPTYAPRLASTYTSAGSAAVTAGNADLVEVPGLPGVVDLADIAHTPSPSSILLGLGAGGTPITVPLRQLVHCAFLGATGGGKTNLMRLVLPQIIAIGGRVVLADPHYTDLDPESGDDFRPIRARLHMAPAVKPGDIDALLSYLVDELGRRLELRASGLNVGPPIFLALDELPQIVDAVPNVPERLGNLLRQGRKVGVLLVGASQDFLVKTMGGTSAARDAYRTAFYSGGDLVSARALLDMPQREIDEGALHAGVAYLRSAATSPAQLVRVPLASNRAIRALLTDDHPSMPRMERPSAGLSPEPLGAAEQAADRPEIDRVSTVGAVAYTAPEGASAASAEAIRAAGLFMAGKSPTEITQELRGIGSKQGARYQQALGEVLELIRAGVAAGR